MRGFTSLVLLLGSLSLATGCQSKSASDNTQNGGAIASANAGPTAAEVELFLNASNAVINKGSSGDINVVDLKGSEIKDKDLAKLKALKGLRRLYLAPSTTDAGLEYVKDLKGLERLYLNGAQVTDEGVKRIVQIENLTHLDLSHTKITDSGLKYVGKLTRLKLLGLSGTAVSDRGMESIKGLERLTVLDVTDTDVSIEGSIELKETLKGLSIRR